MPEDNADEVDVVANIVSLFDIALDDSDMEGDNDGPDTGKRKRYKSLVFIFLLLFHGQLTK